ncbi:MAG: LOG family protein [Chloroflexi bacterium]|nr:LOG family protein [Chloroflexota bacterium]
MSMRIISVFGGSRVLEGSAAYREAYELGRQLALAGYGVANGGYEGTMEALSRGAAEAGGHVIGATSDLFNPSQPTPWLTEERRTPDLYTRLQTLISLGDGFIALSGGIGTLSEVTLVWSLLQVGQISPRPLILLGSNWHGVVDGFAQHTDMGSSIRALAQVADTVEEAMSLLKTRLTANVLSEPPNDGGLQKHSAFRNLQSEIPRLKEKNHG